MERHITDDLDRLRQVLPEELSTALDKLGNADNLIEVVLDLGRVPTARFTDGEVVLLDREVNRTDIDTVDHNIGDFDADNRAGLERTLHRISAIRNRKGTIVGLTCRVGRAVYGTIDIIQDLIESGQSVLMLGPPGVGKTTMLREAARVLAESKRVVIVDTSNEIGGDGDVPHPAIGRARRMQVSRPERQHEVMIEAVENHNPEVIVIDEIGRELEAMAARTIAERGVQLIGTAHGNALDNLMLNPTLSDLVGGIESVTLSDDEARRRGTQKTVLERRAPPTFDVLIEIQTRDRLVVHEDVSAAVDGILRGNLMPVEMRTRNEQGEIEVEAQQPEFSMIAEQQRAGNRRSPSRRQHSISGRNGDSGPMPALTTNGSQLTELKIYAYGVARNRLQQAGRRLRVPVTLTDDFGEANAIVTLKNYYRRRPRLIVDAERRGTPIYVLRANTVTQMENFLTEVFQLDGEPGYRSFGDAMQETEQAIMRVLAGEDAVDLTPQTSDIRRRQHEMASKAHLVSRSFGREPQRHVRILREED
jgi:stage III sporulation protein SpoIIIAA